MTRSKMTIAQLRIMEEHHRRMSKAKYPISTCWNKSYEQQVNELQQFKAQQKALANVFAELIFYRESDARYHESI